MPTSTAPTSQTFDPIQSAVRTITLERNAVDSLLSSIGPEFAQTCTLLLQCKGRVVVTGIGKSGHIARKIAATLASTGTPAFFVHPAEANHGDMGMITRDDIVLALSNSGSTAEIVTLLPLIKRMGIPLVSMTGNTDSTLAKAATVSLYAGVDQEACPLNLAPTSSTTTALVLGDALAIALLEARGFTAEDFAFSHPGGALGRRLLLKVDDIMHTGDSIPHVSLSTPLSDTLLEMTHKGLGVTLVVNADDTLVGLYTDGDLRRTLDRGVDFQHCLIQDVMTVGGRTVRPDMLAAEALKIMDDFKISCLPVVDSANRPVGLLHIHDLTRAGVL